MGNNVLRYKDFLGTVSFSEEDMVFYGKAIGISGLLSFEGTTVAELIEDFHNAVDEYLEMCQRRGIEPQKTFKGSFNVRIDSDLHREVYRLANTLGISLNQFVQQAIEKYVKAMGVEFEHA